MFTFINQLQTYRKPLKKTLIISKKQLDKTINFEKYVIYIKYQVKLIYIL